MKMLETLKWLWDPRSDEQKAYAKWEQETPLQRRTQELVIYIRDREEPFRCDYKQEDFQSGDWSWRRASSVSVFNGYLNDWLNDRGSKGIRIDDVWYSPEVIERIELGKSVLEPIE